MDCYEARILSIEGEDANISYLNNPGSYFIIPLREIRFQGHCCNAAILGIGTRIIICRGLISIDEDSTQVIIKHGKICEYCESDNAIQIRFFSEQITIKCLTEIVFIEDRKIEINELRDYLEFPIEALIINNQCAKVTIVTTIPKKIRAVIFSVNGSSVYLLEINSKKAHYYEVNSSECYENTQLSLLA